MSFSFSVRAASVAALLAATAAAMARVVETQPNHKHDEENVKRTVDNTAQLVAPHVMPAGKCLAASVSGSLSWQGNAEGPVYTGANLNVNVYVSDMTPEEREVDMEPGDLG